MDNITWVRWMGFYYKVIYWPCLAFWGDYSDFYIVCMIIYKKVTELTWVYIRI